MPRRIEPEGFSERRPLMYRKAGAYFFNERGENVSSRLASSFPVEWAKHSNDYDYRNGWTRYGHFFVDDYMSIGEMEEMIQTRFGKLIAV